jgi:glycosyltransferase involved in cell wall biosynthesis
VSGPRRILLLAPSPVREDGRHGGTRATAAHVAAFAERHRVGLLTLRAPSEPATSPAVAARCDWVQDIARAEPGELRRRAQELGAGLRGRPAWAALLRSPRFADAVARAVAGFRPDVVQLENAVLGDHLRAVPAHAACARVVVVQDPGAPAAAERRDQAAGLRRLYRQSDVLAWRRFEPRVLRSADAVATFTDDDRAVVEAMAPGALVRTIPVPLTLPPRPCDPEGSGRPGILFVGNFSHAPNVEAARALIGEILPRVRCEHPDVRAVVVGPHPPPDLLARRGAHVDVTGEVADVRPFLDAAAVVVAPIISGGGMRVKVLEALGAGKAVVATPKALAGLDITPGEHVLAAVDAPAFAAAVSLLLRDADRRAALARAARRWAEERHGEQAAAGRFEALWEAALAVRARG